MGNGTRAFPPHDPPCARESEQPALKVGVGEARQAEGSDPLERLSLDVLTPLTDTRCTALVGAPRSSNQAECAIPSDLEQLTPGEVNHKTVPHKWNPPLPTQPDQPMGTGRRP